MITTYLTSLKATFNPFAASSKIPRLFLTQLPANAHKTIQIKSTPLPRGSTGPSTLELGFKDGKVVKYSWGGPITAIEDGSGKAVQKGRKTGGEKVTLQDIVEEVDRHAKGLARKEELNG
jgi:large subunit ribosomal protein L53